MIGHGPDHFWIGGLAEKKMAFGGMLGSQALAGLVQPGDDAVYLLQVPPIVVPSTLEVEKEAK